jgi:hypothetical protein
MLTHSFWRTILLLAISLGLGRAAIMTLAALVEGPAVLFDSFLLAGILMAGTITVMIYGGLRLRRENGDELPFQRALLGIFSIYAISGLVVVLYNALTFHVLAPAWALAAGEQAFRLTASGMVYEFLNSLILGGLLAVIFAFFTRKEPRLA